MRFQALVDQFVVPEVYSKGEEIYLFATRLDGGWEGWLQVELYLRMALAEEYGIAVFDREPKYPGSNLKADFKFETLRSPGVTTWVELKTQKHRPDIVGSIVVIPAGNAQEILETARATVQSNSQQINLEDVFVRVIAANGDVLKTTLYHQADFPNTENTPVVLYNILQA